MANRMLIWLVLIGCLAIAPSANTEPTAADLYANSMDVAQGRQPALALAAIESVHFNDVWAYYIDTNRWVEIHPDGPLPPVTRNHSAVYDPINQRMICAGLMATSEIWSLSLVEGHEAWSTDTPTTGIFIGSTSGNAMPYFAPRKSIVHYHSGLLRLWNMETNVAVHGGIPGDASSLAFQATALDEERSRLLMYGGSGVSDQLREVVLTPGLECGRNLPPLGDAPPPRWLLRSVVDTNRDRMILFGGNTFPSWGNGDYHDTTYELDLTSDTWHLIPAKTPPSARGQFTTIWDPVTQQQYLFGGLYRIGPEGENIVTFNETWAYDGSTQSWHELLPPPPIPQCRRMATAVFDSLNRRMIVFGGELIRPAGSGISTVRAAIKVPRNGRKIGGNRVTIMAEIIDGSVADVREIRFQYRLPSLYGTWQDLVPAGINHPNPDTTSPYFVHWDVTGFPAGDVDLRAVATDRTGAADSAPNDIVVTIDHANPETAESENADGHIQLTYTVDQSALHDIAVADDHPSTYTHGQAANVRLRFVAGTFTSGTLVSATFDDLGRNPEFDAAGGSIGFLVDLSAPAGQEIFPPGKTVELIFQYPDEDQDGVVDEMNLHESTLSIYSTGPGEDLEELADIVVDGAANTVSGRTAHFSKFVVSGQFGSGVGDWSLYR